MYFFFISTKGRTGFEEKSITFGKGNPAAGTTTKIKAQTSAILHCKWKSPEGRVSPNAEQFEK